MSSFTTKTVDAILIVIVKNQQFE